MPKKRLTTNGNVFRRTDGRWQRVIWYFDEQGIKRRKVFSSKTKTEAQQKITTYIAQFNAEVRNSDESQQTLKDTQQRYRLRTPSPSPGAWRERSLAARWFAS